MRTAKVELMFPSKVPRCITTYTCILCWLPCLKTYRNEITKLLEAAVWQYHTSAGWD